MVKIADLVIADSNFAGGNIVLKVVPDENNFVYNYDNFSKISKQLNEIVKATVEEYKYNRPFEYKDIGVKAYVEGPDTTNSLRNITIKYIFNYDCYDFDYDFDAEKFDTNLIMCELEKHNDEINKLLTSVERFKVYITKHPINHEMIEKISKTIDGVKTVMIINDLGYYSTIAVDEKSDGKLHMNVTFLMNSGQPSTTVNYLNYDENEYNTKAILYRKM